MFEGLKRLIRIVGDSIINFYYADKGCAINIVSGFREAE